MRVKLRAKGKKVPVPTPPAIQQTQVETGGDATPVNSRRERYNGATQGAVAFGPRPNNIGRYIAPPKNPIWTQVPTTIVPTPFLGQQPWTKPCKGCG